MVFKNAARVYGRYRVEDPDNDFAAGTKEIKTPVGPHVISYIPGTNYAIHRLLVDTSESDKTIKDPLPRIAYWNETQSGNITLYNDANTAGATSTSYPVLSQFSDYYASVLDSDLSFGVERPFHIIEANPLNTLYYQYWRPWVNELYSSDARKMTAFFKLTRTELASFEFSDKIYIKDTYWRVLSVTYDATSDGVVQVTLLKILGDIRDCAYIPNGIDKANGQISFLNPSGTTVFTPTQQCCERYGYVFAYDAQSQTNRCYQNFEQ